MKNNGLEVPGRAKTANESEMRALGARLGSHLRLGDVILLYGELGVGKTTLVRGFLESLGYTEPVRSPTFNLIQLFDTEPPVLHADLYRVKSHHGLGLEDELDKHVSFIEWADRAEGLLDIDDAWQVAIKFHGNGREVTIKAPGGISHPPTPSLTYDPK